jgi:hypothetical protein
METIVPRCPDPIGARVAIWGDSMANAWAPGIPAPVITYSHPNCAPLVGYLRMRPKPADYACRKYNDAVAKRVEGLDTVYLVARWWTEPPERLESTLRIAGMVRRVVVIGPSPEMRAPVPKCIRLRTNCGMTRDAFESKAAPILRRLRSVAARYPNVEVIDVTEHFCTDAECPPVRDGVPMYWDARHISSTAARAFRLDERRSSTRGSIGVANGNVVD